MKTVEVRSLTFTYAGAVKPAIIDVDFVVEEGEFVLMVGPSGGGKSTLCRCMNGLIPHFYEGEYKGKVTVFGMEVDKTPTSVLSQYVGMVFQNPQNQLFSLSVEGDVAFPLENLGLPREEIIERVEEALNLLNITHLRDRSPFELSGGQQQRVAIASVLAMRPKIIIMDEPTSYLDPVSAASLLTTVNELRRKLGLTIILVEHRVDLAAYFANRLAVVAEGKIVYDGPPRKFFEEYDPHPLGVSMPRVARLSIAMRKHVNSWNEICLSPEEFEEEVVKHVGRL